VPAYSGSSTGQTPIVPVGAPAPLAAAPNVAPVSSEWPETLGDRPTLRSALAATEVPSPTPPAATAPAPEIDEEPEFDATAADVEEIEDEVLPEPDGAGPSIADLAHEIEGEPDAEPEAEVQPVAEVEPEAESEQIADLEPAPASRRPRGRRRRPAAAAADVDDEAPIAEAPAEVAPVAEAPAAKTSTKKSRAAVVEEAPVPTTPSKKKSLKVFPDEEPVDLDADLYEVETRVDRTGRVNLLAVLALLLGVLASPLAALFGHVALGQLRASGERGVIPAWIAIVLGYLWLGFFLVLGITYLATNG
jgi:hypothetical protein